jgi:23S rRNA (guanine745-N1)-methyltransferase
VDAPLACTVRDCGLALERRGNGWACARGHSFDTARSGYVNLLQPQDRHSLAAGDSRPAIESRARLIAAGIGRSLLDAVVHHVAALPLDDPAIVVDLGSGSGELLAMLAQARPTLIGIGLDLSTAAAEHAARQFGELTWIVANADRRLPVLDRTVDLVLSVHGRRNPAEAARILTAAGYLLVAVPAADDLVELRELVQGERVERDRVEAVVADHARHFTLRDRWIHRERLRLGREALLDLLKGTYRGERRVDAERVGGLTQLEVTLSSDLLLLTRNATA